VTNILSDQAALAQCPPGCGGHVNGEVHISVDQVVVATAYGERREIYVSRELDAQVGVPAVRVQNAGDTPMSPAEALQLGLALISEAFAAAGTWQVAR
jgi:hypothetical protein